MSLEGKRAIVTGSTGELGIVIVRRFLEEGMKVAGTYRNPNDLSKFPEPMRSQILLIQADVTDELDVQRVFDSAMRDIARVDILVNTVGGFLPRSAITDVTSEDWDRMMKINLKSTFLCTREALRRMKNQPYGRIVSISAMTGLIPSPGRSAYAISKAAVSHFTEIAGQEMKGTGITVNAIAPSIIDTPSNRKSMPKEDFSRWVKPENIADVICYLCSDGASDVTGTTVKAFGGI